MRIKDLLSEERAAVPPKPRNFVAKNAKMGGAGQHKDKKKAEKQGDVKHKKDMATMEAFQNDEANIMYRFNPETGLLGQRMIHNDEERVAHQQGYRDSHEAALRVHGIIRSKYDPKKFVQKQGNSWPEVFPYGKKNEDVAEGSDELYQKAIRKYVQQVAHDYLGGDNAHLYGANKFDSKMFGVSQEQAKQDFKTLFPRALKQLQGVAEGLDHNKRQQLIQFLVKKLDWEANYLELASDAELIKWYKNVQAGKKPMGY